VDVADSIDVDYEDLLLLAMKKEKVSFRLYVDLAGVVADEDLHETLLSLAEEEAENNRPTPCTKPAPNIRAFYRLSLQRLKRF
jgi:hypothetical protein